MAAGRAEAARGAYIECPHCGKKITDVEKRVMVDNGEWEATKEPDLQGYRSAWIGGLYAKDDAASAQAFTENFLRKKDNARELRVWVNQDCGETWEDPPKKSLAHGRIWELRDEWTYEQGTCPSKEPVLLVGCVDVQAAHLPYAVWAMNLQNQWLVDNGSLAVLDDIDVLMQNRYKDSEGEPRHRL